MVKVPDGNTVFLHRLFICVIIPLNLMAYLLPRSRAVYASIWQSNGKEKAL